VGNRRHRHILVAVSGGLRSPFRAKETSTVWKLVADLSCTVKGRGRTTSKKKYKYLKKVEELANLVCDEALEEDG
jgi:hypothetical protein